MNFQDHRPKAQGSFGIPEEIKAAHARQQEAKKNKEAASEKVETDELEDAVAVAAVTELEELAEGGDGAVLSKLGAKFDEDDFNQLLFKGTYETTISIIKGRLTAKFKTLTSDEYDQIDEILAKEIKDKDMTQDGLRTRTSMWIISYGITELNGKAVAKPVKAADGKVDFKATAIERRKVFSSMAPAIINQLIQKHGAITLTINSIAANPSDNLKNS